MKKIDSLDKIYKYLEKQCEKKGLELFFDDNKLELEINFNTKIVCSENNVKVIENNKIKEQFNMDYKEIYLFLLKNINEKNKISQTIQVLILFAVFYPLPRIFKYEFIEAIKFYIIYIGIIMLLLLFGYVIYNIFNSIKMHNIDKK